MKKFFVCLMIVGLIMFGGNAQAGLFNQVTVNTPASGFSADGSTMTSWFGFGDDWAWARGSSLGEAENYGEASLLGWGRVTAEGVAITSGTTNTYALAADLLPSLLFGQPTSITAAGGITTATVYAYGDSGFGGFAIGSAYNESTGVVEGGISQGQYAAEIKSGETSAIAGNESSANFYGYANDTDYDLGIFRGSASSVVEDMTGVAGTHGTSFVTVDRYGSEQSAYGYTENSGYADVRGDDFEMNNVSGSGGVQVQAMTGNNGAGAYAGGEATFSYNGTSFGGISGNGYAEMNSEVSVGPHSFSSTSSGSASATTN